MLNPATALPIGATPALLANCENFWARILGNEILSDCDNQQKLVAGCEIIAALDAVDLIAA